MTPTQAIKLKNEKQVYQNLYGDEIYSKHKKTLIFKLVIKFVSLKMREKSLIKDRHPTGLKKSFLSLKHRSNN